MVIIILISQMRGKPERREMDGSRSCSWRWRWDLNPDLGSFLPPSLTLGMWVLAVRSLGTLTLTQQLPCATVPTQYGRRGAVCSQQPLGQDDQCKANSQGRVRGEMDLRLRKGPSPWKAHSETEMAVRSMHTCLCVQCYARDRHY